MSEGNNRWAVGCRWVDEQHKVALIVGDTEMAIPWDTALAIAEMLEAAAYQIRPDQEPEEEAPDA